MASTRADRSMRAPLSTHTVVNAALVVLNDGGMSAVTMRGIAAQLQVQAPSLYDHFRSKEELLAAMADRILAAALPETEVDEVPWQSGLTESAQRVRAAMRAHRDGARVVAGTTSTGPSTLALAQSWSGLLQQLGLPPAERVFAALTLFRFVVGSGIEDDTSTAKASTSIEQVAASGLAATNADLETAYRQSLDSGGNLQFAWGVRTILAGIRVRAGTLL